MKKENKGEEGQRRRRTMKVRGRKDNEDDG